MAGFLGCLALTAVLGAVEIHILVALLPAGAWAAVIGFLDDHRHIPDCWRLPGHFLGAGWLMYWVGGLPVPMPWGEMDLGVVVDLLALVFLVWLLNLYNFMDGIDGMTRPSVSAWPGPCATGWSGLARRRGFH